MFSQTYIGLFVTVAAALLPKLGVEIGNDALTTTISVILTIVGALWAMYGRWRLGKVDRELEVNFVTGMRK